MTSDILAQILLVALVVALLALAWLAYENGKREEATEPVLPETPAPPLPPTSDPAHAHRWREPYLRDLATNKQRQQCADPACSAVKTSLIDPRKDREGTRGG